MCKDIENQDNNERISSIIETMLKDPDYNRLLLIRYEEKKARDRLIKKMKESIKNKDFKEAYNLYCKDENILSNNKPLDFLKEVVREHGTNTQTLQKAVESVAIRESMSTKKMAKLMNINRLL